jgi:hypothetical protein
MGARVTGRSIVRTTVWGLMVAFVVGLVPVSSADPMTRDIEYVIHQTPTDPNSPISFRIKLSLESIDQRGNKIGWDITSIEIREIGDPDAVWVDNDPIVPTQDGLWWVKHDDPNDPQHAEFTMPPRLHGTADAQLPTDDDLDYDFEGKKYTPPEAPEEPPYQITAALDYSFTLVGGKDPIGYGEDEPVEVPPEDEPGGGPA